MTSTDNCPNCGAPLKMGRCEYCGTENGYRANPWMSLASCSINPIYAASVAFRPSSASVITGLSPDAEWFDTEWLKWKGE